VGGHVIKFKHGAVPGRGCGGDVTNGVQAVRLAGAGNPRSTFWEPPTGPPRPGHATATAGWRLEQPWS